MNSPLWLNENLRILLSLALLLGCAGCNRATTVGPATKPAAKTVFVTNGPAEFSVRLKPPEPSECKHRLGQKIEREDPCPVVKVDP
jgi:hypothetical protein